MPSNFASPCWEYHTSTKNATKRCREEQGHKGCDWKDDDRYRDQQEKKAKRPFDSSFISPLHSRSTPGGGAAGRPEDRHAGARSRDTPRHVGGNQRGAQNRCNSKNRCNLCTTSEFTLKCWECACKGGKYRHKNNCFHRCRTESEHTGMDWKQDDRVEQQGDEEVGTLCTKCYSGHEQNPMLLCDGCDAGWHIQCLDPPLSNVPDGGWFCLLCEEKDAHGEAKDEHGKTQNGGAPAKNRKQVDQLSATGNVVAHHLSMTAAAASVNIAKSTMSDVIQNGRECANHFWRYVDGNEGGEGVEVPRRTPTKHDVVISDDKHSSAKDVHCPSCGKIHPRKLL